MLINYFIEKNKTDQAFFIINLGAVLEQFKRWKQNLPRVEPFYAVKCCPDPVILSILSLLGCQFDCASKEEIISITSLDIPTSKIIYANPVKDSHFLKFARSQDVDLMTFDNETELYKIKLYHPYSKLIIRIKT
jgi:ornithine decarboxylase